MTESSKPPKDKHHTPDGTSELLVEKSGGLPLVWLIPIIALLIGLWLAYKTISEQGPTVTILFKEASGLEAGKTKIKYKDVQIGTVETVRLSDDLSHLIITAKMDKSIEGHLNDAAKFWVVEPQFGLGGVSGLDTLIAGHYIEVEFGQGKPTHKFNGLEHAPKISADTPGRHFLLTAESAASLSEGTGVYFRDIKAGRVVEVNLSPDKSKVLVDIFINAPFDRLVHDKSHFWQTSGIDLSMGSDGVKLRVGSLLSLLGGGISFDTPDLYDPSTQPSAAGRGFNLFKDYAAIAEGSHANKQFFVMYFEDSVRGLNVGASVEIKGIRVGTVTGIWFNLDANTHKVTIPVHIEIDPDRLMPQEQIDLFEQIHKAERAEGRRPVMEKLVAQGLRARLKSGSLITGQLYVDLDFYPNEAVAELSYEDKRFPRIPTLPSVTEELQKDAMEIMAKLKRLPLDKIGEELLGTAQGANRLVNSPDLKEAIASLNTALKSVHQLSQTADHEVGKMAAGLDKSLASVVKILGQLEPGAPMAVDVGRALEELAASARSIRELTDYLDRHPEALLQGKAGAKK